MEYLICSGLKHLITLSTPKNISPHTSINGKVPNAVWNGSKPNVSTLRVFECRAWLAIPYHERTKLDPKGISLIFVWKLY